MCMLSSIIHICVLQPPWRGGGGDGIPVSYMNIRGLGDDLSFRVSTWM